MWTDLDPLDLGAAPAESIALWMRAVRNMDRDTLDSFVRRTWRTWSPGSLRPLAVAVDTRRAQLDGE
jgi:uncharacterized protein YbdZ (MbtH family)